MIHSKKSFAWRLRHCLFRDFAGVASDSPTLITSSLVAGGSVADQAEGAEHGLQGVVESTVHGVDDEHRTDQQEEPVDGTLEVFLREGEENPHPQGVLSIVLDEMWLSSHGVVEGGPRPLIQ